MMLQWFLSRTVRQANALRKHVEKILAHQRDILSPKAIEEVDSAMRQVSDAISAGADKAALDQHVKSLEEAANKCLQPYPNAVWRENVEVLLVALTVAMGIRTFFLQPFKIPTGSMQPTLYGITSTPDFKTSSEFPIDLRPKTDFEIPNRLQRLVQFWAHGISFEHVVAKSEGSLVSVEPPKHFLIFTLWQRFRVGNEWYRVWFPADDLLDRAGLVKSFPHSPPRPNPKVFKQGEDILKMKVLAGDHLFVDRLTYNFRPPNRGEIIVFETKGIPEENRERFGIPGDQFYIKRLVGLGGETLSIQQDQTVVNVLQFGTVPVGHLVVNGQPLSAATPHFENLYSFNGASGNSKQLSYQEHHYFGHGMIGLLAPGSEFQIRTNYSFVMGDNTMNSLDSRYWGDFPAESVIGRAFFVYWPVANRFGWGCLSN